MQVQKCFNIRRPLTISRQFLSDRVGNLLTCMLTLTHRGSLFKDLSPCLNYRELTLKTHLSTLRH